MLESGGFFLLENGVDRWLLESQEAHEGIVIDPHHAQQVLKPEEPRFIPAFFRFQLCANLITRTGIRLIQFTQTVPKLNIESIKEAFVIYKLKDAMKPLYKKLTKAYIQDDIISDVIESLVDVPTWVLRLIRRKK